MLHHPPISAGPGLPALLAAAVLAAGLGACSEGLSAPAGEMALDPDAPVVMVVVDTLSASHLGFYGYELDTSPFLDELARTAFVFDGHATQANATFPSMTSILTGLYPRTHRSYLEIPLDGDSSGVPTLSLAERFQARGYYTVAIWSHPFWNTGTQASVSRGWDVHSVIGERVEIAESNDHANATYTNLRLAEALETYRREGGGKPLFLWLHYFDPHTPYAPPEPDTNLFLRDQLATAGLETYADALGAVPLDERRAWLSNELREPEGTLAMRLNRRALYDAEIHTMDRGLRDAADQLRAAGVWDRALLLFLADHGENTTLGAHEDALFTHMRLFEDVVRTPLFIRFPRQVDGRRVPGLTQNIDLLPTLVDIFDLPREPLVEGKSLLPLLAVPDGSIHDQTFTESRDNVEKAVRTAELKYIDPGQGSEPMLYRWRDDAREEHTLIEAVDPAVTAGLSALLEQFVPEDVLCARLAEGRGATLHVAIPDTPIAGVDGPATPSADRRSVRIDADHGGAAVRMRLRRLHSAIRFELSGGLDPKRDVFVGRTPLARSTLIPLLTPADEPAPADPVLSIEHRPDGLLFLRVAPPAQALVTVELRFAEPVYGLRLEVADSRGFGPLQKIASEVHGHVLEARTDQPVSALIRSSEADAELFLLVRIDGAWPAFDRIALDGHAVDASMLRFVAPEPADARITAALMAGPPEPAPTGSTCLWIDGGAQRVQVDKAQLAPEVLAELQKLGYAR